MISRQKWIARSVSSLKRAVLSLVRIVDVRDKDNGCGCPQCIAFKAFKDWDPAREEKEETEQN